MTNPTTAYFVLVKHDEGKIDEWYEAYTIEVRPVPASQAQDFIKEI